jgi:hypothetical protein
MFTWWRILIQSSSPMIDLFPKQRDSYPSKEHLCNREESRPISNSRRRLKNLLQYSSLMTLFHNLVAASQSLWICIMVSGYCNYLGQFGSSVMFLLCLSALVSNHPWPVSVRMPL